MMVQFAHHTHKLFSISDELHQHVVEYGLDVWYHMHSGYIHIDKNAAFSINGMLWNDVIFLVKGTIYIKGTIQNKMVYGNQ